MVWYLYLSETPVSHLLTAGADTPSSPASCSWVRPFALRNAAMLPPSFLCVCSMVASRCAWFVWPGGACLYCSMPRLPPQGRRCYTGKQAALTSGYVPLPQGDGGNPWGGNTIKAAAPCRSLLKRGFRHVFEVSMAPLRLRRGRGAMQGTPRPQGFLRIFRTL